MGGWGGGGGGGGGGKGLNICPNIVLGGLTGEEEGVIA